MVLNNELIKIKFFKITQSNAKKNCDKFCVVSKHKKLKKSRI